MCFDANSEDRKRRVQRATNRQNGVERRRIGTEFKQGDVGAIKAALKRQCLLRVPFLFAEFAQRFAERLVLSLHANLKGRQLWRFRLFSSSENTSDRDCETLSPEAASTDGSDYIRLPNILRIVPLEP